MELEKFENAKKILEELNILKNSLRVITSKTAQMSLEPICVCDCRAEDASNFFISIPQPLADEVKHNLRDLLLQRIEFLENEFKNI